MPERDACPMCGQEIDWDASSRVCGTCRMGIPDGRMYFVVGGRGRHAEFCSPGCVRAHVLIMGSV